MSVLEWLSDFVMMNRKNISQNVLYQYIDILVELTKRKWDDSFWLDLKIHGSGLFQTHRNKPLP